ncbi:hypothetical protein MHYP_G00216450 [Metynnis hypsauchen]
MLSTTVFKAEEVRVSSDLETMPCHPSIHPLKNINMAWEGLMSTALYRAKSSKMAQLAKRPKNCVEGYLHEVSAVLDSASRNKYFTAILQEATSSRVVAFQIEHHHVCDSREIWNACENRRYHFPTIQSEDG